MLSCSSDDTPFKGIGVDDDEEDEDEEDDDEEDEEEEEAEEDVILFSKAVGARRSSENVAASRSTPASRAADASSSVNPASLSCEKTSAVGDKVAKRDLARSYIPLLRNVSSSFALDIGSMMFFYKEKLLFLIFYNKIFKSVQPVVQNWKNRVFLYRVSVSLDGKDLTLSQKTYKF
jgi:hypothetical protein